MPSKTLIEPCTVAERAKRCGLKICGKPFSPRKSDQRFCSAGCKEEYYRQARAIGVKVLESRGAHSARIAGSLRLRSVLNFLSDGLPHTTREIIIACDVCAVNTIISELRDNGLDIVCQPVKGKKGVYEYRMRGESNGQAHP